MDWVVAAAVLAVTEQEAWVPLGSGFAHRVGPRWAMAVAMAVVSGVLLLRRIRPLEVVVAVSSVLVAYYLAYGAPDGLATVLTPVVALYACGRYASVRKLAVATATTALVLAVHTWRDPQRGLPTGPTILFWAAVLGSGLLGLLFAHRSRAIGSLTRRTELLERAREIEALEAVHAERRRIASELHDLVGHGISLMVLQVEGAQALLENGDLSSLSQRLERLSGTARQTMTEMRRLLSVVGEEPPLLHPEPGIAQMQDLVERMRAEGIPVQLQSNLSSEVIPSSLAIAAYRIVLEALTNVVKHAGPGTPTLVRLTGGLDTVTVEVLDCGRTANRSFEVGRGLTGMRERVNLFGGELRFGPRDSGGFAVTATLPLNGLAS
jgi:signal transduction histidine kinase